MVGKGLRSLFQFLKYWSSGQTKATCVKKGCWCVRSLDLGVPLKAQSLNFLDFVLPLFQLDPISPYPFLIGSGREREL